MDEESVQKWCPHYIKEDTNSAEIIGITMHAAELLHHKVHSSKQILAAFSKLNIEC